MPLKTRTWKRSEGGIVAAPTGRDSLESAPQVTVLLLQHRDAGGEFSDSGLECGKGTRPTRAGKARMGAENEPKPSG